MLIVSKTIERNVGLPRTKEKITISLLRRRTIKYNTFNINMASILYFLRTIWAIFHKVSWLFPSFIISMHHFTFPCRSILLASERFRAAAKAISADFGLTLFGFDVIVPTPTSSNRIQHHADDRDSQNQSHRSGGKNGFCENAHDRVRVSSSGACNDEGETCLSQSQERGRVRSLSHHSDCGSIEEEFARMHGPCSTSSLDNFGGDNNHLVVIDINFFPSYKEVPDFPQRLREFLRKKAGMV